VPGDGGGHVQAGPAAPLRSPREIGIFPDILICRTEVALGEEVRAKISLFCNVPRECVIEEKDVDFSIYQIPQMLAEQK